MTSNELNSIEHYIISQLSGVNLNHINWEEEKIRYGVQWSYLSPEKLNRGINEVIVESELRKALIQINHMHQKWIIMDLPHNSQFF